MIRLRNRDASFFDQNPLVSISCINYNHIHTIHSTLDYFLDQETSFPVEILINDDASTDGTSDVIREYTNKYPYLFKSIIQAENHYSKGKRGLHQYFNFKRARGKYIALCDGDDNWVDKRKLQRQVDFLESNLSFSMTSHDSFLKFFNKKRSLRLFLSILKWNLLRSPLKYNLLMLKDIVLLNENFWNRLLANTGGKRYKVADFELTFNTFYKRIYIPSSSIMARSEVLKSIPQELNVCPTGHNIHILWSSCFGKIFHSKEIMSLKNNQPTSLSVTKEHLKNKPKNSKIKYYFWLYSGILPYLSLEQQNSLKKLVEEFENKLAKLD